MAKGIKKIEWAGKGKIIGNLQASNQKIIECDQFVYFKISDWYEDTSLEEKERNILWHFQTHSPRSSVLKMTKKAEDTYAIKLPKKLCGPFLYYLQASLPTLDYSKSAGLMISGWCEPRIISSSWATESRGKDVRKSHYFYYGHPVYLHLDTEGLNGYNNLLVEVHRRVKGTEGIENDDLITVYHHTPVINGEINIILTDTISWQVKNKIEIEEFYIKVKHPSTNEYIKDNNHDVYHARYLRIQNRTELIIPKNERSISKAKVGKGKEYKRNAGSCKFAKIGITYNDDYDIIFDEGKFIRRANPNDNFDILEKIHYDYDKWEIRSDAKPILDEVAIYLKKPPLLPVELGAHTDKRGTDEYNLELSAKRADSVVKYLISKGVDKNLISAKGYGKTKLIHKGDTISEELHQENRRTTLRFKIFKSNAQTLVHDVIVPSYKKPADLRINIDGFTRKGCHERHLDKLISNDSYKESLSHDLKLDKHNFIDTKLHSRTPTVPKIMDLLSFGTKYKNIYHYYLNSCAYYSETENPTFAINAYPDIVWIAHFQYNYTHHEDEKEPAKAPYYFHNKKLELKKGIEQEITELSNSIIGKIMSFFPGTWLAKEALLPYIQKNAKIYDVGLHAVYDREIEKREAALSLKGTEIDFIKTDSTTRYIVAFVIYEMVAIGIVIDLLMLYLTRGKSAEGKLVKITTKAKKVSKDLKDAGAELVPSSIAINTGMYYKLMQDRRMALIFEANIKADPLVAINFERKFNLADLIKEKAKNEDNQKKKDEIGGMLKKIGDGITATLKIGGEVNIEQNVQYNALTEQYSLKDKFSELVQTNTTTYSTRIKGSVILQGNYLKKFFKFSPIETKVEVNVNLKMACEAILITQYGFNKKDGRGLFMEQKLKFSGLKGTFTGNLNAKIDDEEYEYKTNEGKPIDFTVFDGHTFTLSKIYFFNTNSQK